ncbi:MAG TPA: hypothetical protein EYP59_19610 [Thiotrichaceae bacterium]|nr:hypothetical protein [Thiotrichaceae bacterium]
MNKKKAVTVTRKTCGSKTMALDAFHAHISENFRQSLWAEGIKYDKSSWERVDRRMLAKKSGLKHLATLHK